MVENWSSRRLARHLGHDPALDRNPEEDPSHALDPVTVADHDLSLGLDQDQEIVSGQKKDEGGLDRDLNPGLRSVAEVVTDQIQNQDHVQDLARNPLAGKKIRL